MSLPDSGKLSTGVLAAMREVAETIILPRYNQLAKDDIRSKTHPADLVTVADEESERALEKSLRALLPGALVIGEEAVAADPAVLDRLDTDQPVWIIDPIDGTSNFVHGVPRFAVMIALARKGETVMGWIHDPLANRSLWAEQGAGAWHSLPSNPQMMIDPRIERVTISPRTDASLAAMVAGLYHRDLAGIKGKFAQVVRLGSAAHDYWALAEGRMQVLCYRRLKPWDHAAGILIHAEAGGYNRLDVGRALPRLASRSRWGFCARRPGRCGMKSWLCRAGRTSFPPPFRPRTALA